MSCFKVEIVKLVAIKEEQAVINHGVRLRGDLRSSFEEEPEKQLGLLRSFVFVQNIIVAEQNPEPVAVFLSSPSLTNTKGEDTNEH